MKVEFRLISILLFGLVLFACETPEQMQSREIKYKLNHEFQLVLEDHPPRTWSLQTKVINGKELLFFGDVRSKDNIRIFNMDERLWQEPIQFDKEGPNGIGSMNGFYVHTLDSIFVIKSFAWQVHLMKGKEKMTTYDTNQGIDPISQITPFTTNNALNGLINGKLIFYGFPEIPYESLDYHNKVKIAQTIDVNTGKNTIGIGYPEEYHDHLWPGMIVTSNTQAVAGNRIYMNFAFSDSVYSYDASFNMVKKYAVSSIHKRKTKSFVGQSEDQINGEPAYFETYRSGKYWKILVDEKRKLLYRVISYSKSDPASIASLDEYVKTLESNLLVYDLSSEELIAEIDFEKEELDWNPMMFIGEKGLYLSKISEEIEAVDFYLLAIDQ